MDPLTHERRRPGDLVKVRVLRDGRTREGEVKLEAPPDRARRQRSSSG